MAQDPDFRNRYIDGYDFPAVPRFRQDARSWDGFALSWCESVALEVAKPPKSRRSFLVKKVIAVASKSSRDIVDMEAEEIRNWLREAWEDEIGEGRERSTVGEDLIAYHSIHSMKTPPMSAKSKFTSENK